MSVPASMTSEQYFALVKTVMPDFHRVACAETQEAFCEAVAIAVRHALQKLEDRRKLLATTGEVALSTDLADLLTQAGIPTVAEAHVNGHVDLVFNSFEAGRYRTLGECKMSRNPQHHCDGANQLLSYCSGTEKCALCITFCKKEGIQARMRNIRLHFTTAETCHSVVRTDDHPLPWCFAGTHTHSSGAALEILHIGCNLHVQRGSRKR